jgi:secondary thiamine-phosphate synthase enzyme
MTADSFVIRRRTSGNDEILDLTDEVRNAVRDSGIRTGQLALMVVGSSAALSTLEFEPGLVRHDIAAALERVAPAAGTYVHEQTWHDDNGHAHVRAFMIGPSLALPIVDGGIPLGTWQQIVLIDLDTRARQREVVGSVVGQRGPVD